MVFLLMVVVILAFVVMWNFDLHKLFYVKEMAQNAGDSAAMMGARWQALSLNLIGELNLMQALAVSEGDTETSAAISDIQARVCYVGPMVGFIACQQAAKNNRIYVHEAFTEHLREHARIVRHDYPHMTDPNGDMLFPEPYPGAWREYADMLDLAADEGVAVAPDNVRFYGDTAEGGHALLRYDFYAAVAGRAWCWFWHHNDSFGIRLLDLAGDGQAYQTWQDWPDLPPIPRRRYMNSEIFGLGLTKVNTTLSSFLASADSAGFTPPVTWPPMISNAVWYAYGSRWGAWDAMRTTGPDPFPATGEVKEQYDYSGADVAVRLEVFPERLTPSPGGGVVTNTVLWTAAAKPFGHLNEKDRPDAFDLVLPAFHRVGLIALDASSAPLGGGYNLSWREHIEVHLPDYMDRGPAALVPGCWFCRQLEYDRWESPDFRADGVEWLKKYSDRCVTQGGGGGGGHRGGGRRRGH